MRIFGRTPAEAVREGRVGAVLQEGALLDDATVGEIVAMVASLHRSPLPVDEALRRAGVADLASRRSTRLSGGQKQRVRFAVALVCDPELLLLDEPTSAMDPVTRRAFWSSMRDFTERGRTVVFATHHLEEAEEYADTVVFFRAGKVIANGPIDQVRKLASGRVITAVVPGVGGLPGSAGVERSGDRADRLPRLRRHPARPAGRTSRRPRHRGHRGRPGRGLLRPHRAGGTMRYLALELRRALRRPGTLLFVVGFPGAFYLLESVIFGNGTDILPAMAAWGVLLAGLLVAPPIVAERATGWQRQLRLTPLSGPGYLRGKATVGLLVALPPPVVVALLAHFTQGSGSTLSSGLALVGLTWLGAVPFALLGILVGQLATPENVQQVTIVGMLALAIFGGMFMPLDTLPAWFGSGRIRHAELLADRAGPLGGAARSGDHPGGGRPPRMGPGAGSGRDLAVPARFLRGPRFSPWG